MSFFRNFITAITGLEEPKDTVVYSYLNPLHRVNKINYFDTKKDCRNHKDIESCSSLELSKKAQLAFKLLKLEQEKLKIQKSI